MRAATGGQSYRPRTSLWSTLAAWAVVAGFVAAAGFEDGPGAVLHGLPVALGLALAAWLVFRLPRVDVDDAGVTLVNPLRTVHVPWAALIEVRTRYALTLVTPHGAHRAWAAPGPGRHAVIASGRDEVLHLPRSSFDARGGVALGDLAGSPSGIVAAMVRRHWDALVEDGRIPLGEADETPVRVHWHWPALAGLGVAVLTTLGVALL